MIQFDYTKTICQTSSLRRVHERAKALNDAVPITYSIATVNGQEVERPRKYKAITGNVEATAERLVKNYIKEWHKLLKNVGAPALEDGLPPLRLTRPQLSSQRSIGERTVFNHLKKLQELGFLTHKRFRGSKHAFEVWIDPTLLFQAERINSDLFSGASYPQISANNSFSAPTATATPPLQNPSFLAPTANFAAYKASNNSSFEETEKKEGGECGQGYAQSKHGDKNHGNTEQPAQKPPSTTPEWQTSVVETVGKQEAGGGAPASPGHASPGLGQRLKARLTKTDLERINQASRTQEQRRAILLGYVESFWSYAQKVLYPAKRFSDGENKLALNAIWQGVYNCGNQQMDEKEWDNYQRDLYERIQLASNYYARNQDKWIPAPYAEYKTGSGYFDAANARGFSRTEEWLAENRKKKIKDRVNQVVGLAIKHLHQYRTGRAPKALQKLTYIEAYRKLEAKMQTFSPLAHQRFLQLASTIPEHKKMLTTGFTKNFLK
jgi:hypothetical protein